LLVERLVVNDPTFSIETASLTAFWVEAVVERQTIGRHVGSGWFAARCLRSAAEKGVLIIKDKEASGATANEFWQPTNLASRAGRRLQVLHPGANEMKLSTTA
jgi:hypothetical protein